ncbi:hypothetical protein PV10_00431 [Exophiala mesophila]|uniref:Uncharacterized protein n=1 Tax=Exophiala mesophila TaxID=212818 RepID=A0A0D1ZPS2_EXOME|nr:uncharacterized protein PV10_00431 [Exophiala mesophila]KIV96587.1 hypothetical protein PV10_00431 [Exophiala mesophila]
MDNYDHNSSPAILSQSPSPSPSPPRSSSQSRTPRRPQYTANIGIRRRGYWPPEANYDDFHVEIPPSPVLEKVALTIMCSFFVILLILEIYVGVILVFWSVMPESLDAHVRVLKATFF